jgi:DNA-binding beta-propeller fold protein YncE
MSRSDDHDTDQGAKVSSPSRAKAPSRQQSPHGTLLLVSLLAALCALAVAATPALATTGHRYVGQFGGPGSAAGSFSGPAGVAVQQSTGDVYVADQSNNRVQKFSAGGELILAFNGSATPAGSFSGPTGVAVDPSSGDVYVTDQFNNAVDEFSSTGAYISQLDGTATPAGSFSGPWGIAVDPSNGNVYVADANNALIDVFSSTGTYLTQFGSGTLAFPTSVAVDGASNVYVVDAAFGTLFKYPALGAGEPSAIDTSGPQAVAVNPTSDTVYVGESAAAGPQVSELSAGATSRTYTFGAGRIGAIGGLAVNATSDEVYLADQANSDVLQFAPFTAPTVTTGGTSGATAESATLEGTVNPEGTHTGYHFEYGTEESYGASSPEEEAGAGSTDVPASFLLEGLQPNTTYHYRLTAANSLGSSSGEDATFTTSPAPPTVDGQAPSASAITATTATLHGTIDPRNSQSTYHFNYGTSTSYTNSAPNPDAEGGAAGEEAVATTISGLSPSTTYHFQVVAENGTGGPIAGEDETFTTLPPPPSASTGSATAITEASAVLSGSADTVGLSGSYQFLITGTDTPGGGATAPQPLSAANGEVPVSATISGLSPGAHYSYRLAVTTAGGTVYGAEEPLATASAPAYQSPGLQGASGPLSAGLPAPISQIVVSAAPAAPPAATAPKPATKPKPKPKPKAKCPKGKVLNKHHKCVKAPKKRKPKAKKANTNEKGHR